LPVVFLRMDETAAAPYGPEIVIGGAIDTGYIGAPSYGAPTLYNGRASLGMNPGGTIGCLYVNELIPANRFTIEFFTRTPASLSGTRTMVGHAFYNRSYGLLLRVQDGVARLLILDNSYNFVTFTLGAMAVDTEYHFAVTYDPWDTQQCNFYLNGVLVSTQSATLFAYTHHETYTSNNPRPREYFTIGARQDGAFGIDTNDVIERYDGDMAGFAYYAYALPAERILAHYNAR